MPSLPFRQGLSSISPRTSLSLEVRQDVHGHLLPRKRQGWDLNTRVCVQRRMLGSPLPGSPGTVIDSACFCPPLPQRSARGGHSASSPGILASKGQKNFPCISQDTGSASAMTTGHWPGPSTPASKALRAGGSHNVRYEPCTVSSSTAPSLSRAPLHPVPSCVPRGIHTRTQPKVTSPRYLDLCLLRPVSQDGESGLTPFLHQDL